MARDYYEVLGVSRDATDDQIKSAFRQLSKKWHPDLQQGKSDVEKKEAEDKFKELNEAYSTLSDKDKREQYDQFGPNGPSFNESPFDDDMFSGMFRHFGFGGNARQAKRKKPTLDEPENGSDILAKANITFKQSLFGFDKEFDLDLDEQCPHCAGTGAEGGKSANIEECQRCHGTGTVTQTFRNGFMMQMNTTACPDCGGIGYKFYSCTKCHGQKRIHKKKHVKVRIPAGIANGARLRVKGYGQCGTCGGADGNLFIEVHIQPSEIFTRLDNDDLLVKVKISSVLAALGGEIEFPALKKMKKLKIPAGTKNGTRFKAKGEGIKDTNGRQHDILVDVLVETPTNLTKEQKELLEKLQKTLTDSNLPEGKVLKDASDKFYKE